MTVGKAIYYLLTNASDVTAIVGTRIYPEVAQQNAALPYIVYNVSNNEPSDTKREPSKLDTAEVEVNVFSEKYTQAIDMGCSAPWGILWPSFDFLLQICLSRGR